MIIAIDFDGTLHDGEYPKIGEPLEGAIKSIRKFRDDGHFIILWTCRDNEKLTDAINWLLLHDIPFHSVNDHEPINKEMYGSNTRKVFADIYIDDRQVGGLPSWSSIVKYVSGMPIYKKKALASGTTSSDMMS